MSSVHHAGGLGVREVCRPARAERRVGRSDGLRRATEFCCARPPRRRRSGVERAAPRRGQTRVSVAAAASRSPRRYTRVRRAARARRVTRRTSLQCVASRKSKVRPRFSLRVLTHSTKDLAVVVNMRWNRACREL